jgi:hypothetical protein
VAFLSVNGKEVGELGERVLLLLKLNQYAQRTLGPSKQFEPDLEDRR